MCGSMLIHVITFMNKIKIYINFKKVGTKTLMQEFSKLLTKDVNKKNHDNLLDELKLSITESVSKQHQWDIKAMDSLVSLKGFTINFEIFQAL
jgi:hypothetical protein